MKPIFEIAYQIYGLEFEYAYDRLKQFPKTNRELLRVIDESVFKVLCVQEKSLTAFLYITYFLQENWF
jgi:hypothetical protein